MPFRSFAEFLRMNVSEDSAQEVLDYADNVDKNRTFNAALKEAAVMVRGYLCFTKTGALRYLGGLVGMQKHLVEQAAKEGNIGVAIQKYEKDVLQHKLSSIEEMLAASQSIASAISSDLKADETRYDQRE